MRLRIDLDDKETLYKTAPIVGYSLDVHLPFLG